MRLKNNLVPLVLLLTLSPLLQGHQVPLLPPIGWNAPTTLTTEEFLLFISDLSHRLGRILIPLEGDKGIQRQKPTIDSVVQVSVVRCCFEGGKLRK